MKFCLTRLRGTRIRADITGNDAAAKRDVIAAVQARFPPARLLVAETLVQGPRAASAVVEALRAICAEPEIDVVVLARGGGSFEGAAGSGHRGGAAGNYRWTALVDRTLPR